MYNYNSMKGVLEPAYMLGMPLCYSSKIMIAAAVSVLVGLIGGFTMIVVLLVGLLIMYIYFKNKASKYGENEAEIRCYNSRQKKIYFDDSCCFEKITSSVR